MDFKAILKVRVIEGHNLAVRDFIKSDPYVKLRIGDHKVKTRVIKNNLNPKWDEELTLVIQDPPEPLKLVVFDWDTIGCDDKMGDGQIDLDPLMAAARLWEGSQRIQRSQEGTNICKIVATKENSFVRDSVIKVKDGQIVQDVCIKLQNVESGQIEMELKLLPLH